MMKVNAKIKLLHPEGKIPRQATNGSAGFDCFCTKIERESDNVFVAYLGFSISFPKDFRLMFVPRSSLTKTNWILQNSPGIGDSDYRGEYKIRFRGLPKEIYTDRSIEYGRFPYEAGDRVVQMYFAPVVETTIEEVENLSETKRGEGGFGSTGK